MSLHALAELRRAGHRPNGPVTVLLGDRPRGLDDDATIIVLRPADAPVLMDWRPMVGLMACIVVKDRRPDQTLAVLRQLEPLNVGLFGYVDAHVEQPLMVGATPEHATHLRRTWELLCR